MRIAKKWTSALLAVLLLLSVMSTAFGAAEITDESEEAILTDVGTLTPVITALEPVEGGVRMSWEALEGVSYYRVYRWYDDGRGWVKLTDTEALEYVDQNVSGGNTYRYRLVGTDATGGVITTTVTQSVEYSTPAGVTNAENVADGIRVYWDKAEGSAKTAVYRMTSSGWKRIATSADASYLDKDVAYNNEYRYTVRALTESGSFMSNNYDDTGLTIRRVATPELKAESAFGGVKISWNAVAGAEGYRVFYRNSKGGWTRLGDTTETSLLDDDVRSNRNYTYTVRCISADGKYYTSYFNTSGKAVKYIAAPVLVSAEGTGEGIRITWKASEGAAKYRIFYRNSKGNWARMVDTADTTYHDKDVAGGRSFTYTIRCLDSSGNYISSFDPNGVTGTFLSSPDFKVSNAADGVTISWEAVKGAVNYRVFYRNSKGGWTKLTDTSETSVLDTDVSSNHNYTYTVRCITADGSAYTSGYLSGKSVKYIAAPKITNLSNTENGVKITWGAVAGAVKYRVYYYGRNGWTKMDDVTSTSYVDKVVASGTTYTYTVRCITADGKSFTSYFRPGVQYQFIAPPDFSVRRNADGTITISWNAVKGAVNYRVYERVGSGSWSRIGNTTETSYIYANEKPDDTRVFTVRCMNADATEFTSYFRAGKGVSQLETPKISSLSNTTEGVKIAWKAVAGAVNYRVFYRNSKGGWTKLTDTTETSVVDTDVSSNHNYTYTVRCVNAAGDVYESGYDNTGTKILYIASPKNLKAETVKNTVKISWTASAGAAKYRVYYKSDNGWTKIGETTSNSYVHSDPAAGTTYTYTVRCITSDGKSFTSDFDHQGVVRKFTQAPVLQTPELAKGNGILIKWNASKGADKYRVYYYGSKGWTKMAETTGTSYTDYDISSGHNYRYTVRCITADGKEFTSDYDSTGVKIYFCSIPQLQSITSDTESVSLSWTKPSGASRYRVYKRVNGTWKRISETTANSYKDTDVSSGSTYTYTVRVVSNDGKFYSYYDTDGFSIKVGSDSSTVSSDFYYYDQGDYSYPYGDDTIAYSGCGPTCFAMVVSTLKNQTITPVDAVKWCGNEYYVYGVGTRWDYFEAASKHFGITMEGTTDSIDVAYAALKQGKYVISSQTYGIFTRGGHFITLAGVDSSGKVIVYDPNGGNHYVGATFSKGDVDASGTNYWIFSK